ncbi:MAG: S41 family peptidase [Bacteroidota bacterium]
MTKIRIWLPFIFASLLAIGIYVGMKLNEPFNNKKSFFSFRTGQFNKINDVVNYISQEYVDTVNQKKLVESTIEDMLHQLDPHSAYIPAEDLQAMNEPLEGNFDGIGVEFHVQQDTIMVVTSVSGGPSDQLGIRSGDRIVQVEGKNVAGIHITNTQVTQLLRGPSGTKVKVGIYRRGNSALVEYAITRGKIPVFSVDVAYMLDDKTGYIKVSHFAERTYEEYIDAFSKLKEKGLQSLILDLRGNPGGYLKTAIQIADEFLPEGKLIVYTQGHARPKESFNASARGFFERGKLIVLIDEGSASASEIVSGAVQDWDRATVVGRRSFGKGLVQEQSSFPDGSAIRLTIARYYTPTGRSIQKPYSAGYDEYENELFERMKKGEFSSSDSVHFSDSLKFKTPGGKIVYGGGGIMPDIFVPLDTIGISPFFNEANGKGLIVQYAYDFLDIHRKNITAQFADFSAYKKNFSIDNEAYSRFVEYALKNGVKKEEKGEAYSSTIIRTQLKALIARQIWKNDGFYPIIQELDVTLKKAEELMKTNQVAEASSGSSSQVKQN